MSKLEKFAAKHGLSVLKCRSGELRIESADRRVVIWEMEEDCEFPTGTDRKKGDLAIQFEGNQSDGDPEWDNSTYELVTSDEQALAALKGGK